MNQGAEKVFSSLLYVVLLTIISLDVMNVYGFSDVSAVDCYCSIVMDLRDCV